MKRAVTMADVAARAGVSVSTVSHVINETRPVSPELRAKVMDAIRSIGYSPNMVARSLATSDTRLIGIVMSALTNQFFLPVVAAIDSAGRRHGYSSVLADSRDRVKDEADAVSLLLGRRVDGIILAPTTNDKEVVLDRLAASGVPTVLIDRLADPRFDQVGPENVESTAMLVEHLATAGHKKIAFISGISGLTTTAERVRGYRLGLERCNLPFRRQFLRTGHSAAREAEAAVTRLLESSDKPTAIISGNNFMTIGILRALQRLKINIPEDMAVVSYDDIEFADVFRPGITAIAQPIKDIANLAVQLLIDRIRNKGKTSQPQTYILPTRFIHRDSCGCSTYSASEWAPD